MFPYSGDHSERHAFCLLDYLQRHEKRVVSQRTIPDPIWNDTFGLQANGADVHVRRLRHKRDRDVDQKMVHGIPAQDPPRIFERLFRGEEGRSQRGLGLGLSMVQAVIRAHKGRIEAESSPGTAPLLRFFCWQ